MVGRPRTRGSQNSPNRRERTQGVGSVDKVHCVHILTNQRNTVLYTGVTGDLGARAYQHREKLLPGFTNRYNVSKLVYYEAGYDASGAIARKKTDQGRLTAEEDRPDQRVQS